MSIFKGPLQVSTTRRGKGSSLCTGYRIKTFQITSCQHKFCLSPRNFSAVRAFWSKFPLSKLHFTSSPKLASYKSHYTSQPSLCALSKVQDKQTRTQIIQFGSAGGLLKHTVYPLIAQLWLDVYFHKMQHSKIFRNHTVKAAVSHYM